MRLEEFDSASVALVRWRAVVGWGDVDYGLHNQEVAVLSQLVVQGLENLVQNFGVCSRKNIRVSFRPLFRVSYKIPDQQVELILEYCHSVWFVEVAFHRMCGQHDIEQQIFILTFVADIVIIQIVRDVLGILKNYLVVDVPLGLPENIVEEQ